MLRCSKDLQALQDCWWSCAELEILADGLHIILIDPYNAPKLKVRYPHSSEYKEVCPSHLLVACHPRHRKSLGSCLTFDNVEGKAQHGRKAASDIWNPQLP